MKKKYIQPTLHVHAMHISQNLLLNVSYGGSGDNGDVGEVKEENTDDTSMWGDDFGYSR